MSFTITCNNCDREFEGNITPEVARCPLCKEEGCETCVELTECSLCGERVCRDCLEHDICLVCNKDHWW